MAAAMSMALPTEASANVHGPDRMGTGDTGTFFLNVNGNASYEASIPGGAVEPEFGIVDGEKEIEVTVPDSAGSYLLRVVFTFDDGSEITRTWLIDVVRPYVFTATVVNSGDITVTGIPVKFILNGDQVIHETTVDLAPGEEKELEYRFIDHRLSSGRNTITVTVDPQGELVTLATGTTSMTTSFYIGQPDYSLSNWIMGITLLIMSFALVWVYRKPKRNLGRPRGRRR